MWVWTILQEQGPLSPYELWEIAAARGARQMAKSFASIMSVMHTRENLLRDSGQFGRGESQILDSVRLEIPRHLRRLSEPPHPGKPIPRRF